MARSPKRLTFKPLLLAPSREVRETIVLADFAFSRLPDLQGAEILYCYENGLFRPQRDIRFFFHAPGQGANTTRLLSPAQITSNDHRKILSTLTDRLAWSRTLPDNLAEINAARPEGADPHDFVVAIFRHCVVIRHADPVQLARDMRSDLADYPSDPYVRGRLLTFGLPAVTSHHEILVHATGMLDDMRRYQAARPDIRSTLNSEMRIELEMPTVAEIAQLLRDARMPQP